MYIYIYIYTYYTYIYWYVCFFQPLPTITNVAHTRRPGAFRCWKPAAAEEGRGYQPPYR